MQKGKVKNVMQMGDVMREWMENRKEVMVRRQKLRMEEIEKSIEIIGGLMIEYINMDEVIRIISEEEEKKKELMSDFEMNEVKEE